VSKGKSLLDKEILRKLYWEDGMTMNEIAGELFVSPACVYDYMHLYGIETRPKNSEPKLYDVGNGQKMTTLQIAEKTGCTRSAVMSRLVRGWRGERLLEPVRHTGRNICRLH